MATLSPRDRRALLIMAVAVLLVLVLQFGVLPRTEQGALFFAPIEVTEKRLQRLQQVARQKPRAIAEAEAAARELVETEKGLLKAATPALASAAMQQIMKDLLSAQGINLQASEFGTVKKVGEDYAQVPLTVVFTCGIDQWINLMTALRNAPQVLSSVEVRITPGDSKNKTAGVRMVVAGYIPASLVGGSKPL